GEIGSRQKRHLPPSLIHPITGRLSYHGSGLLHLGQCEGGYESDSPRGSRQTTTFRNDPTQAPMTKTRMMKGICMGGNPKHEIRNPKQIRNSNFRNCRL